MKIFNSIYALFEGLRTVGIHLFRRPTTLEYPEKKDFFNSRFRGRLAIRTDEHSNFACIGCRACVRVCPAVDVIKIESHKEDNQIIIDKFEVDVGKCISCGNCTMVCPRNVLVMSSEYELANSDKTLFLRNKGELTLSYEQSKKLEEEEE